MPTKPTLAEPLGIISLARHGSAASDRIARHVENLIRLRTASSNPRLTLLVVLSALLVVSVGYGVSHFDRAAIDSVPRWALLALISGGSLACVVRTARDEALLAPFGFVALTVLVYFAVRPLQLSLSADTLTHSSYNQLATPLQTVLDLRAQELTLFIDTRMTGTFDDAMTRALGALTLFFGVFLFAYRLGISARAASGLSRIGSSMRNVDLRWVIAVFLIIGLTGELIVLAKIGGIGSAFTALGTQGSLSVDFTYLVILNFYTAGLLMWICWHTPSEWPSRLALGLAILELVVFYALLGSRTLVLIPILLAVVARNELVRPWPLRMLIPTALVGVLFASAYLVVRENSRNRSFSSAIASIPQHAVAVQTVLNSSPVFDQFLEETSYVPTHVGYRYGGELSQGLLGQVPRFLDPHKPEATDTSFRKLVWGNRFLAGRPVGAAGEFYRDFGFVGIVIGGLLLGFYARALTGLRARAGSADGQRLRTCLFVVGMLLLFQFIIGSYSLVFGEALEIGIPLALGLTLFARSR
jgi:oligosaccharide repeat unit polymerase